MPNFLYLPAGRVQALSKPCGKCAAREWPREPMTCEIDGRQQLVIMTGEHHFMGMPNGEQIAYALPDED